MNGHELLRDARERLGYSREELAQKSGVAATTIYKIESGSTSVKKAGLATLTSLADALNITLDDIANAEMERPEDEKYLKFINNVSHLPSKDEEYLKNIRTGFLEDANAQAMRVFYSNLPTNTISEDEEYLWFAVAVLVASDPNFSIASMNKKSLGSAIGLVQRNEPDNLVLIHRLQRLLEQSWDSPDSIKLGLPRLNELVRWVRPKSHTLDYARLLRDLVRWANGEESEIQHTWMKDAHSAMGEIYAHTVQP